MIRPAPKRSACAGMPTHSAANRSQVKYYFAVDARTYNGHAEQEEEMTQEQFNKMMDVYLQQLAVQEPGDWSAEARQWAESKGPVKGDDSGNKSYKTPLTKKQAVVLLHRFQEKADK